MNIRTPFTVVGLLLSSTFHAYASEPLALSVEHLIETHLPRAEVGIVVLDATSGRVVYARAPHIPMAVASVTKLFVTAAALYQLGPEYHYTTTLRYPRKGPLKNDVVVTFHGDPSLTRDDLRALIHTLRKKGLRHIKGRVLINGRRLPSLDRHDASMVGDLGFYYEAPSGSVILDDNAVRYTVRAPQKEGVPIRILSSSPHKWLHIINHAITVSEAVRRDHCSLRITQKARNTVLFEGCWPVRPKVRFLRLSVPDPISMAKRVIKQQLKKDGVVVDGGFGVIGGLKQEGNRKRALRLAKSAEGLKIMAQHVSAPLSVLLSHMLHVSDDVYASSLFKTLGFSGTGEPTDRQASYTLKAVLKKHTSLKTSLFSLKDGEGSRYDIVSPFQISQLLLAINTSPTLHRVVLPALAQPGEDGTLEKRLLDMKGRLYAKTGSMSDTSALAGFLFDAPLSPTSHQKAKGLVFALIVNHLIFPPALSLRTSLLPVKNFEDSFVRLLSQLHMAHKPTKRNTQTVHVKHT